MDIAARGGGTWGTHRGMSALLLMFMMIIWPRMNGNVRALMPKQTACYSCKLLEIDPGK